MDDTAINQCAFIHVSLLVDSRVLGGWRRIQRGRKTVYLSVPNSAVLPPPCTVGPLLVRKADLILRGLLVCPQHRAPENHRPESRLLINKLALCEFMALIDEHQTTGGKICNV
jgi:hypothetical protein